MKNLSSNDLIVFNSFDVLTKKLLYTKYNFNFARYKLEKNLPSNLDNLTTFKNFLDLNESTWDKPYVVKQELKKYFNPITPLIISYVNAYGNTTHNYYSGEIYNSNYISYQKIIEDQFVLNNYSDKEIRFEQDYFVYNTDENKKYTKWNFDYNLYSIDFNVWGSKLLVFTDFIHRAMNIEDESKGYVLPESFRKYFKDIPDLDDYIIYTGVSSPYPFIYNNTGSINWEKYSTTNNIQNVSQAKSHFYVTGQFEMNEILFSKPSMTAYKKLANTVVLVKNGPVSCNGFLYKPFNDKSDSNIYLITCYHVIQNTPNLNVLRCYSGMYSNTYNSNEPFVLTVDFEIIGYDIYSDILVAKYDKNLPFNVTNNVDLQIFFFNSFAKRLNDYLSFESPATGTQVFTTANLGEYSNNVCYKGTVIDSKFSGLNTYIYTLAPPDSLVVNFDSQVGSSGSPIFIGDPESLDRSPVKIVGMINSYCEGLSNHTQCISFLNLINIAHKIIKSQAYFDVLNNGSLVSKNYIAKYFYTYKWLGVYSSYFNVKTSIESYPQLNNLSYTGGIIIGGFIIGFNYNTKEFVSNELELSELNVIKLDTPLLKTQMYRRFIESSKSPIVVKSISFYNNIKSEYKTYYLGKYGEQNSMSVITYDFGSCQSFVANSDTFKAKFGDSATLPDNLLFKYFSLYGLMDIEYYYYDSVKWVLEKETVGGNTADWFNTYKDTLGNTYFQHKFEYPHILTPYLTIYEDKEPSMKLYENKDFKNETNAKSWWSRMRRRLRRAAQRAREAAEKVRDGLGYGEKWMAYEFPEDQPIAYQILSTIASMADTQQEERNGPNISDAFD